MEIRYQVSSMSKFGCRDRKLFERFVELIILWLRLYTSNTGLTELLYISTETRPEIFVAN